MYWHFSTNALLLAVTAACALIVTFMAWQRRSAPGGTALAWLVFTVVIWAGADALMSALVLLPHKIGAAQAAYVGIANVPPLWFVFAHAYSRQRSWLMGGRAVVLWVVPLITIILALTNDAHHLLWANITLITHGDGRELNFHRGPWFWVNIAYSYGLLLAGTAFLVRTYRRVDPGYHLQSALLVLAAVVPWLGNVLYVNGWTPAPGLDPTPIAFTITSGLCVVALRRSGLFDLVPVARAVVVEQMSDGVIMLDAQERVVDLNPVGQTLLGLAPAAALGQPFSSVFPHVAELARIEGAAHACIVDLGNRSLDVHSTPLQTQHGGHVGRVVVIRDVSALRQAEAEVKRANQRLQGQLAQIQILQTELTEQALRDPLTGTYNRRSLHDMLDAALRQAAAEGSTVSVVMIDIDYFKRLNDTFEHQAGDDVLKVVGGLLTSGTRSSDMVCRYGGEEFVVVLPGTSLEVAIERAANWATMLEMQPIVHTRSVFRATLSAGVAVFPAHGTTVDTILDAADQALYAAKAQGRNRACEGTSALHM